MQQTPSLTKMLDNSQEKDAPAESAVDLGLHPDDLGMSLLFEMPPWYASLFRQVRDLVRPPQLPPLKLTSKPVAVKELWGDYRYGKVARPVSLTIHAIIVALLLIPIGTRLWRW